MFSSPRGLDSFDQYLQDVAKYPLIQDRREESELARRARRGDKEAAERLVTANLRFVISYVKKYQGRGLGLSELVCIGNEGLLKAVKKFDPDKGVKFISYAVWWIRQTILQALAEQTRSVRIPLNQNSPPGGAGPFAFPAHVDGDASLFEALAARRLPVAHRCMT